MGMYDELGDMMEILDDFVIETNELIEQLNQDLLLIESEIDEDVINRIFRAFHTIKGTSGFLAFDTCMELAHASEDLLNKIRNGEIAPNPEIIDVLLESTDWFKMFMIDVEGRVEREYNTTDLENSIAKLLKGETIANAPGAASEEEFEVSEEVPKLAEGLPPELIDEFVLESNELVETVGNELMSLEIEPDNSDLVNEIFRVFHTIKGNSGLVGLDQMSQIAHKSEDVLGLLREKKIEPNTFMVDTLLSSVDYMRVVLEEVRANDLKAHDVTDIFKNLHQILGEKFVEKKKKAQPETQAKKSEPTASKKQKAPSNKKRIEQTIRVDVNRLDNLMNIAGELVLGKNRLLQVSHALKQTFPADKDVGDLDSLNNSLGYITTEIQESVMQMRMLPIANVFRKFPRMVRDLAKEKNKEIDLVITGEETELDRSVIEAIGDPMIHLLRNALDHGVETPEVRESNGKPRTGIISLDAFQEGNQIVILIKDDGAGINPDKILAKSIEKGIITPEEGAQLKPKEIINLIFKPGFSTAEKITDVSGRGVGMDVVNTNISRLNGSVEIESEVNKGSVFIIKLPLTLTIMTGMVVQVWEEMYIIPLTAISETLRMEDKMISSVKGHEVLTLRNSVLPILRLDKLLDVPHEEDSEAEHYIVIVTIADRRLGLVVSSLLGQEETVVKPLGQALGKVKFFAGATLRGDGRVSLILDVPQILESGVELGGVTA
mgnify:CR=1 FL=1